MFFGKFCISVFVRASSGFHNTRAYHRFLGCLLRIFARRLPHGQHEFFMPLQFKALDSELRCFAVQSFEGFGSGFYGWVQGF